MIHFSNFSNIILKKNTCRLFINMKHVKTYFFRNKFCGVNYAWNDLYTIPGPEAWNRNFFAKVTRLLHENDQKYFIQSNLHCYLHIFPTSPESDECHANKTVRLLNQTSYPAILVHFRTKWSVVQPSLENKRHAPVFSNWTSLSFPWPVSLCVMGIIVKKNDFVLPSSIICRFSCNARFKSIICCW